MKIKNALLSTAAATASLFAIGATAQAATVTVKSGDTVSAIAAEHNTTIDAITKANQLKNANLIFVGQQLEVNGNGAAATTTTQATQTSQPAATTQSTQSSQTQTQSYSAPVAKTTTQSTNTASTSNYSGGSAKAWIAGKESGGSYSARNGQYIGKYQLSASYLNGDYSAANQERVADSYVASRYGSWDNAKSHWLSNGWY
ncbi:LysM domain-containing protein [Lactiplantibacillus xiangfangensis]|uniref:Extracellular protein n=1 Tax=Lactiplantibacillus xiangfangensis TaxID=942150 RepID=A0A0R2MAU8_9LACO|nr:LysM domain-containing protein [Lactiplantibacillus xiangfangensis]KRO10917.1 extracellular protein [Lactiplantibacillus xiangfangensis]